LNTTWAAQTETVTDETLGSSNENKSQDFQTSRRPILKGQRLDVREPNEPPAAERAEIEAQAINDAVSLLHDANREPMLAEQAQIEKKAREQAISIVRDLTRSRTEIWVRWQEVDDFYASGPRDRHYVVDHINGLIRFGDGVRGMIPARGTENIRMTRYQTGGGAMGNVRDGTITQVKSTLRNVEKVTNVESAGGGADAEDKDALLVRAPRTLRHGDRAVTAEDYEDLAIAASTEVARARCVPLRDLSKGPFPDLKLGQLSVIIVPRATVAMPMPSRELLERVKMRLVERSIGTAHISVVGPVYFRVSIEASVVPSSAREGGAVERSVRDALDRFLHPLTGGGADRAGWSFGREPQMSDLYACIEAVDGVDYVDHIMSPEVMIGSVVGDTEDLNKARNTGFFLVCSGSHRIRAVRGSTRASLSAGGRR
ncbi:MAG: putative baseplate assembly protein, partial [Rudaea sp.]